MPATNRIRVRGLNSFSNEFSEVPEGALRIAQNVVINRPSIVEPRRGLRTKTFTFTQPAQRIVSYAGGLIQHNGTELRRGVPGVGEGLTLFVPYSGSFSALSGFRLRFAEANRNLYVTSDAGVRKLDQFTGQWRDAGVPRPLDMISTLTGSTGFLPANSAVAYRATLHYDDENKNRIVSAPSQRLVVGNAPGTSHDVDLTVYLPDGLSTEYFLRIFRSAETGSVLTTPNDELQLVAEVQITSAHISQGYVDVSDGLPSVLRGAALYTNPSQEGGIAYQNDQPPLAADIVEFNGHLVYVNLRSRHRLQTSLVGVGPGALNAFAETGDISTGSAVVQNIGDTTNVAVGMRIKGAGIPATARVLSVDSGTQITMTENATATTSTLAITFGSVVTLAGREYFAHTSTSPADQEFEATTGGTPAENIEQTALAFTFTVNLDPGNTTVYAFYTSGFEDVPGSIDFEERAIGGSVFTFSSSVGTAWSPESTTAIESDNDLAENGILISKNQQPEAVPLGFRLYAGTSPIRRAVALRDAVYLFSDQIYQLSGTSLSNFSTTLLDTTTKLLAPETAVSLNDQVFFFSDQGVAALNQNGVRVVSRAIEDELLRISSSLFADFSTLAYCIAYESERSLLLAVPDRTSDTYPTRFLVYNAFTDAWTSWTVPSTAGVVNPVDDRLYVFDPEATTLRQERKTYTLDDYADESLSKTVTAYTPGSFIVTLSNTTGLAPGWVIRGNPLSAYEATILEVLNSTQIRVDTNTIDWKTDVGFVSAFEPIEIEVQWLPFHAGSPGELKHWQDIVFLMRSPSTASLTAGFATDFQPSDIDFPIYPLASSGGWGVFPWGESPWGGVSITEQPIRALVPRERSRSHWINVSLRLNVAFSNFQSAGWVINYEPMSSRFTP